MSEMGDDFRRMRHDRRKHKQANSHLCDTCGTTVWKEEKECRRCGTKNHEYEPPKVKQ